jgi:hypothetical protein
LRHEFSDPRVIHGCDQAPDVDLLEMKGHCEFSPEFNAAIQLSTGTMQIVYQHNLGAARYPS